jgi:WD40 repeat protein
MLDGNRPILGLALSPDEQALAIGVDDEKVSAYLWQIKNNTISSILEIQCGGEFRGGLAFSPDGQMLAVGLDYGLILWPVAKVQRSYNIEGLRQRPVTHVSFSPDGRFLASGSKDGTVMLCNVESGETWCILSEGAPVRSLAFSSDGKTLAAGVEWPPRVAR